MLRRTNKYIPVMLNSTRSKKSGWKTAFLILFGIVTLIVIVLIISNQKQPFSTVTPSTTPAETVSANLENDNNNDSGMPLLPEVLPDSQIAQDTQNEGIIDEEATGGLNPVETLIFAYRNAYSDSQLGFLAVANTHSLRMLSFKLALAQANGNLVGTFSYFEGLEKGETPGEWRDGDTMIKAAGGNYEFSSEFSTGSRIEGKVSSTMTRIYCTVFDTDGDTPIRTIEIVKGADGYYAQVWDSAGVYKNTRYFTGPNGLNCAMDETKLEPIFEEVPVNWETFATGSAESARCTEGGAIVTVNGDETICNLS